jgi:hypothetical protein
MFNVVIDSLNLREIEMSGRNIIRRLDEKNNDNYNDRWPLCLML